ncbi:DUF397 domain-containing protein [Actinomadura meridiana]|uniref:DUF397 domain-containing protein n=1 Tax=Actinomadura meridiana TaxID=559626 RepID=A0ABP8CJ83_9ACTN
MTEWRKSSHSGTGSQSDCVELAALPGTVGIRDSKNPNAPALALPAASFRDLLTTIKRGDLDRA